MVDDDSGHPNCNNQPSGRPNYAIGFSVAPTLQLEWTQQVTNVGYWYDMVVVGGGVCTVDDHNNLRDSVPLIEESLPMQRWAMRQFQYYSVGGV